MQHSGSLHSRKRLRTPGNAWLMMLAAALLGCAGQTETTSTIPDSQHTAAVPVSADQLPELPPLAELTREGSAETGDRRLDGVEFDPLLPKARTFADGQDLNFSPAGDTMDGLAYAIYHFDLPGYSGAGTVATSWETLPAAQDYYIGIANYTRGTWTWFNTDPAEVVTLPGTVDFLSPTEQVYVVVALTGTAVHKLTEISFGVDQPPVAVLRPQYYFFDAESTVEFDASASSDDSAISKFEWDLDSDGTFELDSGLDPLVSKHYQLAGEFTIQLRVTDDAQQSSVVSVDLHVDSSEYDETEGNNDVASADVLPAGGFEGWDANLGFGGYDGGTHDYYSFTVTEPMQVVFEVEDYTNEVFQLDLYNFNGANLLREGAYMSDNINLFYYFATPGTFIIDIDCGGEVAIDYSLNAIVSYGNTYDEVEPNNLKAAANALDPDGFRNFWAHLGSGGYDGGTEDWYSLDVAEANTYYTFEIDNYIDEVNLDLELYDGDTLLESSAQDFNFEYLGYGFAEVGTYYLRVFVRPGQDAGAGGDYLLHLFNNGEMPEVILTAVPDEGSQPLTVVFDASDSVIPPGNFVLEYFWDLNGDGYTEVVTYDGEPSVSATYYAAGTHTAQVVVRLATLAIGSASTEITVTGAPSEAEPNNDFISAQPLPAFPFSSFYGDVGPGGYDGGSDDIYTFTLNAGKTVHMSLDYQPGFILLGAQLYTFENDQFVVLAESYEHDGNDFISYANNGPIPMSMWFAVVSDPGWPFGFGGYRFSGSIP